MEIKSKIKVKEWENEFDELYLPKLSPSGNTFIKPLYMFPTGSFAANVKDFIRNLLTAKEIEAYERGLHETAIKMDKNMAEWLKTSESEEILKKRDENNFQNGYEQGRLRCLQQHYGKELENTLKKKEKEVRVELLKQIDNINFAVSMSADSSINERNYQQGRKDCRQEIINKLNKK